MIVKRVRTKKKKNYEKNKDKVKIKHQEWRNNNTNYMKNYRYENRNILLQKEKDYSKKNKIKRYQYRTNRYNNDPIYKLSIMLRNRINESFRRAGYMKESRTFDILGISFEYFKIYLESKFESWMNWSNHGLYNGEFEYGWDIDHIEPLFPECVIRSEEDIIRLNHYTNLQPLCSKINRDIKKNRIDFEFC